MSNLKDPQEIPLSSSSTLVSSLQPIKIVQGKTFHSYAQSEGTAIPHVPVYFPYTRDLVRDKIYKWCSCGLSTTQPWCDGKSHIGSKFKPLVFSITKGGSVHKNLQICGCKYSSSPPYCDGSHSSPEPWEGVDLKEKEKPLKEHS